MVSGALARAADTPEDGDGPMPPSDLTAYLDDLERLNVWFRGYALTVTAVDDLASTESRTRPLVIADIGGARGDLAVRLARHARQRGRPVTIVVVDRDETSLALGRRARKDDPEIRWVQAEATALPFRPGGIDIGVMALTLHHLEPDGALATLSALRRSARLGAV